MNDMHGLIFAYARDDAQLKELAEHRAASALPFGGRYRVIDFMLSSMVAAGVTDVGVLMRESYQSLLDHLGSGKDWDLSRKRGGLRMLPPFSYAGKGPYEGVFLGNMAALRDVSSYLSHIRQEYVVLAGGCLVANLPLEDALRWHVNAGADITALCTPRRLGKPEHAYYLMLDDGGHVSDITRGRDMHGSAEAMGVYILSKARLESLVDYCHAQNLYDFERDVLLSMSDALKVNGYVFDGFAARMSTVESYFQHNMDMLRADVRASLFTKERPIKTKVRDDASTYYAPGARVRNCVVADGCYIEGDVENSVIFRGVRIGAGARVYNSILMQDTTVSPGAIVRYAITDKEVVISEGRMVMGYTTCPYMAGKGIVI